MGSNGKKAVRIKKAQKEHPKNQVEVMSNTMDAITEYAVAKRITTLEASQVLILNELRCIHWHLDAEMALLKEKT